MSTGTLLNSVLVAGGATVLAHGLAFPVALAVTLAGGRLRSLRWMGLGATVSVLMLPAFFVAGAWMEWTGFAGAWRLGDGLGITRVLPVACSAWVLGLLLWPVPVLALWSAWRRVDGRLLEAHPELGRRGVVLHLLVPAAASVSLWTALLVFVLAFANFPVPAVFQARVWPAEVWLEFSTRLDAWAAVAGSWPALVATLVLGLLAWARRPAWVAGGASRGALRLDRSLGRSWTWAVYLGAAGVILLGLVLPVGRALAWGAAWGDFPGAWGAAGASAWRSAAYAGAAASAAMGLGILLARFSWPGGFLLLLLFPGILVGFVMIWVLGVPLFRGLQDTPVAVVLALVVRYGVIGWGAAVLARRAADRRLREVARLSGASRAGVWWHTVLAPGASRLIAGWLAVYLLGLWDVETVLLVIPPGGEPLSVVIFNLLHYGRDAQVGALCLLLGMVAFVPLGIGGLVLGLLRGRAGRRFPGPGVAVVLAVGFTGGGCSPRVSPGGARVESRLFERVEVVGGRGTGPGFFNKPRSVAVDAEDCLYVVDMTGRVQKFTPEGRYLLHWQMEETAAGRPKGMATSARGVWVLEPHYHRLNEFDPSGRPVGRWGVRGVGPGQLWFPRAVAAGLEGDCYISEYGKVERVQRFRASDGAYLGGFGRAGSGPGEFNRPEGLGLDAEGRVYVADSCNHRIQVFDAGGRWLRSHGRAGQGPGEFSYPYDVRVDGAGFQFVCEFGNSRIQVLDAEDRTVEILGGPGTAPDRMNNPWSVCLDSRGNLYVADSMNHRVLRWVRRRRGGRGGGGASGRGERDAL